MAFTSYSFIIFFPVVFFLYWKIFSKSSKQQNNVLLLSSTVFYVMTDWKFIFLLVLSGFVNFWLAKKIVKCEDESIGRRFLYYSGILFNVGILLYFKYLNFFIDSFVSLYNSIFSGEISFTPLNILLPLGISFFTFQMIGYLIDVENEEVEPTNNFLNFFTYLLYFPKILSGPIERIQDFLPQIQKKREFNYSLSVEGARQILWGVFKKVVIANNITVITNAIYSDYESMNGSTLFLGSMFYIVSLYADFSGFSDMVCGISKLFGIKITNNFSYPFFSTNISEFWKKWHISLTTWMMNYVYTPLSFVTRGYQKNGLILSIIITFLLVGVWHGANWTFVVFGLLHGLYFIPIIFNGNLNKKSPNLQKGKVFPFYTFFKMIGLFVLVSLTAIVFRSNDLNEALSYFKILFSKTFFKLPDYNSITEGVFAPLIILLLTLVLFIVEWFGRKQEFPIQKMKYVNKRFVRWGWYMFILLLIVIYIDSDEQTFIYFQF